MLNVFDRMENIVWKGEYAGMQNFLISHNILVNSTVFCMTNKFSYSFY